MKPLAKSRFTPAVLAVFICTGVLARAQVAPSLPAPANPPALKPAVTDEILELSPFQVNSTKDRGYSATSTLMGSRTNTDLKDIANPLDIFTKELIDDLAVTDIQGLTEFASGVSANSGGTFNGDGQEREIWSYNQMVIRGFKVSRSATRNFVDMNGVTYFDAYDSERVEFSKGPNSILFGAGEAGGTVNYSTKVPKLHRNSGSVQLRTDDNGSLRGSLDVNQVLRPNVLGVRFNALKQNLAFERGPSYDRAEAMHLTATWKPLAETTLTVGHEYNDSHRASPKGVLPQDAITPYLNAGRPRVVGVSGNNVTLAGSTTAVTAASQGMRTQNNTAGVIVLDTNGVFRNVSGTATGATYNLNGEGTVDIDADAIGYPRDRVIGGSNGFNFTRYNVSEVNLTHKVIDKLYVDLAFTYMRSATRQGHSVSNSLQVDPNDFGTNTHFGQYYVESRPFWIERDFVIRDCRATASYELDLTKRSRWLGNHRLGGMLERNDRDEVWDNGRLTLISTPNGPINPNAYSDKLRNSGLSVVLRDYLDFSKGNYALHDFHDVLWTKGISQGGYVADLIPRDSYAYLKKRTQQDTKMLVLQSNWWKNRLVTTVGYRDDTRKTDEAPQTFDEVTGMCKPVTLVSGAKPNAAGAYRAEDSVFTAPTKEVGGIARNYGGVFHATSWMSLTYSYSTNFSPAAESKDMYGNFLNPSHGQGKDYGLRLNLIDNRLAFSLLRFETSEKGTAINGSSYNSPASQLYAIEGILTDRGFISDRRITAGAFTTADTMSKGYEATLTASPTDNWNLRFSGSQTIARLTHLAPDVKAFFNQYRAYYGTLDPTLVANGGGTPLGTQLVNADNNIALMTARENAQNFPSSEYVARLTAKYSFSRGGSLKGLSVGGNYRWESAPVVGYYKAVNSAGSTYFDVTRPAKGDTVNTLDVFFIYQRRLTQKINSRFQLNIGNIIGDTDPYAVRLINDRDAADFRWVATRFRPVQGRTFTLTSTLEF